MKKVMCALAAVAAGVAFAEGDAGVTSANIVGYQNKSTRTDIQAIIPTFTMVGDGDYVNLKDISVTGYIADEKTEWNGPSMTRVDSLGYTMKDEADWKFLYNNEFEDEHWGGHWLDNNYGDYIEIREQDTEEGGPVLIKYGEGLYVNMPAAANGETFKLVFSGAVSAIDSTYELGTDINCIGNPMPVAVSLSDIDVTGYVIGSKIEWNGPSMTKVDSLGYTTKDTDDYKFLYNNEFEDEHWGGHWLDNNYGDYIEIREQDTEEGGPVYFQPGEGLYVNAPSAGAGGKVQIIFSSPIADHDAE